MNLYATITSERATKGQGGNEYLYIRVKNKEEKVIADLEIQNGHFRFWEDGSMKPWNEPKDPAWLCVECGKRKENYEAMYCDKCWETKPELKGEKEPCDECGEVHSEENDRMSVKEEVEEIKGACSYCGREGMGNNCTSDDCPSNEIKGEKQKGETVRHSATLAKTNECECPECSYERENR